MTESRKTSRRWRHVSRFTLHVSLLLLLSACGFQLRGHYQVPEFLQSVTLQTPGASSNLRQDLRLELERKNIVPTGGELILEIVRENLTRQTSTVDSSARAAEYTLIFTVEFRVKRVDGQYTGRTQPLILRRSYQYSDSNVSGKAAEEETLVRELQRDAAQQIVRQLCALQALPAANSDKAEKPADTAAPPEAAPAPQTPASSAATPTL